ncbi:MAG: DUF1285 domain-containing protein [Pseudomonadota bacterium]
MSDHDQNTAGTPGNEAPQLLAKVNGKAQPREYQISIARDGTWFHAGQPIRRVKLVKLFATVLKRLDDGQYWLETPAERGVVSVADAPFVAVEVRVSGAGDDQQLTFRTNLDEQVTAGPDNPIFVRPSPVTNELTPYLAMDRGLSARINRAVYYELADIGEARAVDGEMALGVMSGGRFYPLGTLEEGG